VLVAYYIPDRGGGLSGQGAPTGNPQRQALGQAPTTTTSMPGLAALLWIKRPGESDGICRGETTYLFSPRQANRLTVNSPFVPMEDRRLAAAAGVPAIPLP
jgi:endoglucanase